MRQTMSTTLVTCNTVSLVQVCATYYDQQKVVAEIKTVAAVFEKNCEDQEICEAPVAGYGPGCVKTYKHVCYKQPALTPVVRKA